MLCQGKISASDGSIAFHIQRGPDWGLRARGERRRGRTFKFQKRIPNLEETRKPPWLCEEPQGGAAPAKQGARSMAKHPVCLLKRCAPLRSDRVCADISYISYISPTDHRSRPRSRSTNPLRRQAGAICKCASHNITVPQRKRNKTS